MSSPKVCTHAGDLPDRFEPASAVAVDTEAMGLNLSRDRLCAVQVSNGDGVAHIVHFPSPGDLKGSPNLRRILGDPRIEKIYHYARFDLAIILKCMGVYAGPCYCTKIASRLCRTYTESHSLGAVESCCRSSWRRLTRALIGVLKSSRQGRKHTLPAMFCTCIPCVGS